MWYIYSFLDWLTDWLVINIYKKISSDTHRRFSDYLNFPFTFHLNTTCHPLPVLSTYSVLLFILAWKSTRYILQNQPNRKNCSAKSLKYKSPDIMAWRKRKIVKESSTGRFFKHSRRKRNYKCNILQFGEIRIILGKNIYHLVYMKCFIWTQIFYFHELVRVVHKAEKIKQINSRPVLKEPRLPSRFWPLSPCNGSQLLV